MPNSTEPSPAMDWRELIDLSHTQMERDRAYFDRLYKRTVGTIAAIAVAVATAFGMVGFNSVESMERQVQARIAAEFETARIREIVQQVARKEAAERFEEAIKIQVAEEVGRRQPEISAKIDAATQASIAQAISGEVNRITEVTSRLNKRVEVLEKTLVTLANNQKSLLLNLNYAQIHFASVAAFVAGWRSS